jgi:hypothetical protein
MDFQHVARNTESWLDVARRLRAAAHTLWRAADFDRPAFRPSISAPTPVPQEIKDGVFVAIGLAGLALENLAKAVLIQRNPSLVSPQRIEPDLSRKHELHDLFQSVAIGLEPDEKDFLFRAEGFVRWSSRYPVPLTAVAQPLDYYTALSDDREIFEQLYSRLEETIRRGP